MILWPSPAAYAAEAPIVAPPDGFVDLRAIPGLEFDIRYASADNFTGAPLPGYALPGAWLRAPAVAALVRAQALLAAQGYGLRVFDAYRPERASRAMVAWTVATHQQHLVADGYIAARSLHNRGVAIDLTLTHNGVAVDMGTEFDVFDASSHTRNAAGPALENRLRLAAAMTAAGFTAYPTEWWHFQLPGEFAPIDVPYDPAP